MCCAVASILRAPPSLLPRPAPVRPCLPYPSLWCTREVLESYTSKSITNRGTQGGLIYKPHIHTRIRGERNTREYCTRRIRARIREDTHLLIRRHILNIRRARICRDTRRIRENTREYAGCAANKQANTLAKIRGAANTQDMLHKGGYSTRQTLKNTRRIFLSIRRVFAYGFGYISHSGDQRDNHRVHGEQIPPTTIRYHA